MDEESEALSREWEWKCSSCGTLTTDAVGGAKLLSCLHVSCAECCGIEQGNNDGNGYCSSCNRQSDGCVDFNVLLDKKNRFVSDSENSSSPLSNGGDDTPEFAISCPDHQGLPFVAYCMKCRVASCLETIHANHQALRLPDAALELRSDLSSMLPVYFGHERTLSELGARIEKSVGKLDKKLFLIQEQIDSLFAELQAELEKKKSRLKRQVEEVVAKRRSMIGGKSETVKRNLYDLSQQLRIASLVRDCKDDVAFVQAFGLVTSCLSKRKGDTAAAQSQLQDWLNVNLQVNWAEALNLLDSFVAVDGLEMVNDGVRGQNGLMLNGAENGVVKSENFDEEPGCSSGNFGASGGASYVLTADPTNGEENGYGGIGVEEHNEAIPSISVEIGNTTSISETCFVCLAPIDLNKCASCSRWYHENCVATSKSSSEEDCCGFCKAVEDFPSSSENGKQRLSYTGSSEPDYTISMEMGDDSNDGGNLGECVTFIKDYLRQEFPGMSYIDAINHVQCLDELASNFGVSTAALLSSLLNDSEPPTNASSEAQNIDPQAGPSGRRVTASAAGGTTEFPVGSSIILNQDLINMAAAQQHHDWGKNSTRFLLNGAQAFRSARYRTKVLDTLDETQEGEIMETIRARWRDGRPMTIADLQEYAFEYCELNGVQHYFDQEKRRAPYKWWARFKERHPDVKSFLVQINSKAAVAQQPPSLVLMTNGEGGDTGLPGSSDSLVSPGGNNQGSMPTPVGRPPAVPMAVGPPERESKLLNELLEQMQFLPPPTPGECEGMTEEERKVANPPPHPLLLSQKLRLSREQERSILRTIRTQGTTRSPFAIKDVRRLIFEVFARLYSRVPHDFDASERLASYSFWSSFKCRYPEVKNLVVHSSTNRCIFDQKEREENALQQQAASFAETNSEGGGQDPNLSDGGGSMGFRGVLGRPRARLSTAQERYLVKQIKARKLVGNPMTINDVRAMIFDFCEVNGIQHDFDPEERKATYYFWTNFKLRNPDVKTLTIYPKRI